MALKPMGAPAPAKTEFVKGVAGRSVLPAPKKDRVKKGDDPTAYALNFMLYGPWGSGKTYAIEALIRAGKKVFIVVTDIGGNGVITIKLALKKAGLAHLASNYRFVELNSHEEVQEFIDEPATYDPEFYEFAPDFLVWDGFGFAQQTYMAEASGELIVEQNDINGGKKEVSELRETGLKFELADYGVLRQLTVRTVKAFCGIHNKVTGQLIHKIFTTQESLKSKGADQGGGFVDSASPLLTGAGGVLSCGAFDLIIRTSKTGTGEFEYGIELGKNTATKNRGFSLPKTMPADFGKVWATVCDDLDIKDGAVDVNNIAPVLVGEAA
jgi:hypothetical protein